jgi:hypothetical protein
MTNQQKVKPSELGLRPAGKRGRPSRAETEAMKNAARKSSSNLTKKERVEVIAERMTVMYRLTQGIIKGKIRSLIVSGAPGMGKSFTTQKLLTDAHENGKIRAEVVSGAITGVNLYKLLFRFSAENDVILLDDCDSIYEDEDSMNLLKAATDTLDDVKGRKISWLSESSSLKSEDIPTSFYFKGTLIFITNKDLQMEIDYGSKSMAPHYRALMSRAHYVDLRLHDIEDCFAWVEHMVKTNHILVAFGLDRGQETEALQWLEKNVNTVRELSIRTARKVAEYMLSDPSNWETFARVVLLR